MNVDDAFHALVHDYPGGSESLAPRMGMSAAVLRNKANPECATHLPTVRDLRRAMTLSGDLRPLHALCAEFAGVFVHGADGEPADDMAVLELIASVWARNGDLGQAVHHALVDHTLTQTELDAIKASAYCAQERIAALVKRLESMTQPAGSSDA